MSDEKAAILAITKVGLMINGDKMDAEKLFIFIQSVARLFSEKGEVFKE